MRKIFLITAVVLFIGSIHAQFKPTGGTFGMEVQFRPFGNNVIESGNISPFLTNNGVKNLFGVSARYFCIDQLELRADLLFGFNSNKTKSTNTPAGQEPQITRESGTLFGLNLGVNYHFKGTERISPYVGAVVGFGLLNTSKNISHLNFIADDFSKAKQGGVYTNFAFATGFNWYIVNGLYLGAEVGLGLEFAKELKSTTTTKIGGTENKVTVDPSKSAFGLNFYANPAIRLGWKF
jgi:outer membrane protein W